jgi:hypothetical protein
MLERDSYLLGPNQAQRRAATVMRARHFQYFPRCASVCRGCSLLSMNASGQW